MDSEKRSEIVDWSGTVCRCLLGYILVAIFSPSCGRPHLCLFMVSYTGGDWLVVLLVSIPWRRIVLSRSPTIGMLAFISCCDGI